MSQTVLLGDEVELAYGKGLPQRSRTPGNFPVYGSNGKVDTHTEALVKGPGIIIGRKGSVGEIVWSDSDFWPIDTTYYLKLKKPGNIKYWYYQLKALGLEKLNSHSAIPGLNRDVAYAKEIIERSIGEQDDIANILGKIDEKIELNRQMNETLEIIGQALFKHYFIDNSEAKILPIDTFFEFEKGVEPGSRNYLPEQNENSVPFLRVGDMSSRKSEIFVDRDLLRGKIAKSDDVLVSFDGAPGLVSVGLKGGYSSGIQKIVVKKLNAGFAYFYMKSIEAQRTIEMYSEGTTIKHASKAIKYLEIPFAEHFDEDYFQTLLNKIEGNLGEVEQLMQLRGSLLPRLISGKIKV